MIGQRLKELRNTRNISQRALAKELNVAPSVIAMYELDEREPNHTILTRIADYFSVTTDFLLSRENSHKKPISSMTSKELDDSIEKEGRELVALINQLPPADQELMIQFLKLPALSRRALSEFLKTL